MTDIKTRELIDDLKSVCANYGLNDRKSSLKFSINDKFIYESDRYD